MNVIAAWPRLMEPDVATAYVGGISIFNRLLRRGILKPRCQRRGLTRYDLEDLEAACDRITEAFPEKTKPVRRLSLPPAVRRAVLERDHHLCHYCEQFAETVDHKTAHSRGGSDDLENLVAACADCNRRKHAKPYELFVKP